MPFLLTSFVTLLGKFTTLGKTSFWKSIRTPLRSTITVLIWGEFFFEKDFVENPELHFEGLKYGSRVQ